MALTFEEAPPHANGAAPPPSAQALGERIEILLARFDATAGPRKAREDADELVRTIVQFYGAGLERVLAVLYDAAGERGDELLQRLCDDSLVESLLVLHDLHPLSLQERVARALDGVRPYLQSHDGDVEVERIDGDVVYVKLAGSCDGCRSSAATLKFAVEKVIFERLPEIREVRATSIDTKATGSLRLESEWLALDGFPELARSGLTQTEVAGTPVVLARIGDATYAFRDRCPNCSDRLTDARLAEAHIVCAACDSTYDPRRAGRARGTDAFLEPLPLIVGEGRIRMTIPLA